MRTPLTWFFPSSALRQHFSNFPTTTHSEKHICWLNPAWAYVYMCFRKKIDKSVLNAVCSYFPFKSNWFVLSWLCTSAKPLQLCLTLCIPMHCSPPGFSIHGILQARKLEWVAMPSSRGSSWPRNCNWLHWFHCPLMVYDPQYEKIKLWAGPGQVNRGC